MPSSKSIYLQVINPDGNEEFYSFAIKVPEGDEVFEIRRDQRGSIPVLTPIKAANFSKRGSFVAVGKTVYFIGGNPIKSQKGLGLTSLFRLDNTKKSWESLAPMRNERSQPQTVAVDDKIYVIAGANDDADPKTQRGDWGEVFDPKSNKWDPLCPPPHLPEPSQLPEVYGLFAVALPKDKKFVLGSCVDNFLYFYEAEKGCWEWMEHKKALKVQPNMLPVGMDSCLIWLRGFTLYAYDWIKKRSYRESIEDLDKVLPLEYLMERDDSQDDRPLLHLSGNLFCFFCVDHLRVRERISLLHCVTLDICSISLSILGKLKADVKSSQVFVIPTPARICGAVVLTDEGYEPTKEA